MLNLKNAYERRSDWTTPTWSCRNRTLGKTKPCLVRLFRGDLAPAKWTGIKARHATHQQGRPLPLDRHLRTNGAPGALARPVRTEEACPLSQPLVESFRTVLPFTSRECCGSR